MRITGRVEGTYLWMRLAFEVMTRKHTPRKAHVRSSRRLVILAHEKKVRSREPENSLILQGLEERELLIPGTHTRSLLWFELITTTILSMSQGEDFVANSVVITMVSLSPYTLQKMLVVF